MTATHDRIETWAGTRLAGFEETKAVFTVEIGTDVAFPVPICGM